MYSHNKNENDFLEKLSLLAQVIIEQKKEEREVASYSGNENDNDGELDKSVNQKVAVNNPKNKLMEMKKFILG